MFLFIAEGRGTMTGLIGEPRSWFIETIDALKNWDSDKFPDPYNRAELIPLKLRPRSPGPRLMNWCSVIEGFTPGGDVAPQGSLNSDSYNFSYWPYVDILAYFTHILVAPPPVQWINAGHRNGVPVLGCMTTQYDGPEGRAQIKALITGENGDKEFYVKKLVQIANYYGFDGWALNFEDTIPESQVDDLVTFLENLKRGLKDNPNKLGLVIWYDSIIESGKLDWQQELNDNNKRFFQACDGIFLDFKWTEGNLKNSAEKAIELGRNPLDVYVGIDINKALDTATDDHRHDIPDNFVDDLYSKKFAPIADSSLSVGLIGAPHTYKYSTDGRPFQEVEREFWIGKPPYDTRDELKKSVSKLVSAKPVLSELPFFSTFNFGNGRGFYIEGKQVERVFAEFTELRWSNLSAQSILPDMRCPSSWGDRGLFQAVPAYDWAWDGGSSLRISNQSNTVAGRFSCIDLFIGSIKYTKDKTTLWVSLKKDGSKKAPKCDMVLCSSGTLNQQAIGKITPTENGELQEVEFQTNSLHTDINKIQIRCEYQADNSMRNSVLLGAIRVTNDDPTPPSIQDLNYVHISSTTTTTGNLIANAELVWTANAPGDMHYNVYYSNAGPRDSVWFLGRAFVTRYYLDQFRFDSKPKEAYFIVQPTNSNGVNQPLDECKFVQVKWTGEKIEALQPLTSASR
jgi:endo-beta-N-acetylglucosaminidase D